MKNKIFEDYRGFNMKFFEKGLAEAVGFGDVKEIFATTNKRGVIRAFHYQANPRPQQKIVKPLCGSFNVRVIDMENKVVREYDNWNNESDPIFVKAGNMLGYVALEENSVMLYIADEEFIADLNSGVSPFSFNVNWNFNDVILLNSRDEHAEKVDFDHPDFS